MEPVMEGFDAIPNRKIEQIYPATILKRHRP